MRTLFNLLLALFIGFGLILVALLLFLGIASGEPFFIMIALIGIGAGIAGAVFSRLNRPHPPVPAHIARHVELAGRQLDQMNLEELLTAKQDALRPTKPRERSPFGKFMTFFGVATIIVYVILVLGGGVG